MANDLKKIKGLTNSRDLSDRVGVAMFLYARNFDMETVDSPEKGLAQWAISNAMQADQTMLALIATDPDVVSAAELIEPDITASNKGGKTTNSTYTTAEVSVDNVDDSVISAAVEKNWTTVAQKFAPPVVPTSQDPRPVAVTNGDTGYNPFLDLPPAPTSVEAELIKKPEE